MEVSRPPEYARTTFLISFLSFFMMKFPSPYLPRPAGCCCLLCVLNIYSFIAVYYTLFYTFCKGQTCQRIFYFWVVFGQVDGYLYIYAWLRCKNMQQYMYSPCRHLYYTTSFTYRQQKIAVFATQGMSNSGPLPGEIPPIVAGQPLMDNP